MTSEEQLWNDYLSSLEEGENPASIKELLAFGMRWADSHPLNPWKSVKEMPVNVWCYCRDKADERPYLAIIEDTGECFNEDMDVCFPKYFMPIPELPKED